MAVELLQRARAWASTARDLACVAPGARCALGRRRRTRPRRPAGSRGSVGEVRTATRVTSSSPGPRFLTSNAPLKASPLPDRARRGPLPPPDDELDLSGRRGVWRGSPAGSARRERGADREKRRRAPTSEQREQSAYRCEACVSRAALYLARKYWRMDEERDAHRGGRTRSSGCGPSALCAASRRP